MSRFIDISAAHGYNKVSLVCYFNYLIGYVLKAIHYNGIGKLNRYILRLYTVGINLTGTHYRS